MAQDPINKDRIAQDLHRATLRLLRNLRKVDEALGLSAARASALSVLVFVGPKTIGELARIEQVAQPSMSALVRGMQADGLVRARPHRQDRRVRVVAPTAKGKRILEQGRRNRVAALSRLIHGLSDEEAATLEAAAGLIERLSEDCGR